MAHSVGVDFLHILAIMFIIDILYEAFTMHISATYLKNKLGECLETSIREPVIIEKSGRPTSVVLSYQEYQRLTELEDELWGLRAMAAEKSGYLGVEESAEFLHQLAQRLAKTDEKD